MPPTRSIVQRFADVMARLQPNFMFVLMIFGALIAFEIFNYSTTDHALQDLLGTLEFSSMRWSTILALAFCGIDFAGIARLFTPEQGMDEPKEVWYLFGAWLLAATMNAILTWWGVSMAITNHQVRSTNIIDPKMLTTVVPVFVAMMVWVIRILIIGTLSMAMDRMIHIPNRRSFNRSTYTGQTQQAQPTQTARAASPLPTVNTPRQTFNRSNNNSPEPRYARSGNYNANNNNNNQADNTPRGISEPTYHSLSVSGTNQQNRYQGDRQNTNNQTRRT